MGFKGTLLGICAAVLALSGCTTQTTLPPSGAAGWHGASPNTQDTFRFVILSDRTGGHIPGEFEKAVAEVNLLKPDFVMCVGDLIEGYTTDETVVRDQWQEIEKIVSRLDAPFYYCPGNHDVIQNIPGEPAVTRKFYLQRHSVQGKSYYSFDYKGSHFLVIDSPTAQEDQAFAREQMDFVEQDLLHAQKADHIFVFSHYPLYGATAIWPRLLPLLPKGRTTVFTGHWHNLNYKLADGIPVYVLPSTAAKQDPSEDRLYAQVVVHDGKPTISLISPGQIRPAEYAQVATSLRDILKTAGISGINAEGGEVRATPTNTSDKPVQVRYQWLAADWDIAPADATVTVPPHRSDQVRFFAKPLSSHPTNPTIVTRANSEGFGRSLQLKAPISRTGQLGKIAHVSLDGQGDEYSAVTGYLMADRSYLFEGADAWQGPQDSSCILKTALIGDDLAVFIEARDDQFNNDQQDAWTNDAIELCWDVRPDDQRTPTMTAGTGQITIVAATEMGPAAQVSWSPAGKYGLPAPATVRTFTRKTAQGFNVEILIPLADLGLDGGTAKSGQINLSLALDDRDVINGKGILKRSSLTGTGEFWRSPAGYGRFTLKK